MSTNAKKYLMNIINSVGYTFGIFCAINVIIYYVQMWMNVDLSVYNQFGNSIVSFFTQLGNLVVGAYSARPLHRIANIISIAVVIVLSIYFIGKFYNKILDWAKSNPRTAHLVNYMLILVYLLYTVCVLVNVTVTLNVIYRSLRVIANIVVYLLSLDNIGSAPGGSFAINLLLRYALMCFSIYLISKIKLLWHHLFVEKVKIENNAVKITSKTDPSGMVRIVRFFYNELENKLNTKNIYTLIAVLTSAGFIGVITIDAITDGELLSKYCK